MTRPNPKLKVPDFTAGAIVRAIEAETLRVLGRFNGWGDHPLEAAHRADDRPAFQAELARLDMLLAIKANDIEKARSTLRTLANANGAGSILDSIRAMQGVCSEDGT